MQNLNKNILVTGGAGYIGSHVCKKLHLKGYLPIVIDNLEQGNFQAVKWGPLEVVNIKDKSKLNFILKKYKPTAVMHFASLAYVEESVKNPEKYYDNNVYGSMCLLSALQENKIDKIIFSSSCSTYGIPKQVPILETHSQNPINPYGRTKLIIEQILKDYEIAYNMRYVSLRYFNAAGADPDGEIGEQHEPETHLIPLVLQAALGNKAKVKIFGNDYETQDGTCVRDYIHVNDLADAHILALEFLIQKGDSKIYNLGSEKGFSVMDIIKVSEKITNKKIPFEFVSRRKGDPPVLIANSQLISKELGWKKNFNNLEQVISSAWTWHKNFIK